MANGIALVTGAPLPLPPGALGRHGDGKLTLFVRPHDVRIAEPGRGAPATVRDISAVGPRRGLDLVYRGLALRAELRRELVESLGLRRGDTVPIEFAQVIAFPRAA